MDWVNIALVIVILGGIFTIGFCVGSILELKRSTKWTKEVNEMLDKGISFEQMRRELKKDD